MQLDVKGCKDVYASFDKYVEVEKLEGDNKYHAEQYGLQVIGENRNQIMLSQHKGLNFVILIQVFLIFL